MFEHTLRLTSTFNSKDDGLGLKIPRGPRIPSSNSGNPEDEELSSFFEFFSDEDTLMDSDRDTSLSNQRLDDSSGDLARVRYRYQWLDSFENDTKPTVIGDNIPDSSLHTEVLEAPTQASNALNDIQSRTDFGMDFSVLARPNHSGLEKLSSSNRLQLANKAVLALISLFLILIILVVFFVF